MHGRSRYIVLITVLLTALLALVVTACYHKTPEQRAERVVRHLVTTLNLDAAQTAKLEKMKEEFLAKRPDMVKMREETFNDIKEMMMSAQLDQAKLNARTEKIQAQTSDLISEPLYFSNFARNIFGNGPYYYQESCRANAISYARFDWFVNCNHAFHDKGKIDGILLYFNRNYSHDCLDDNYPICKCSYR